MTQAKRAFTLISEEEAAPPAQDTAALAKANTEMLLLALRALSQRALTAISTLFSVMLVVSVWLLWARILSNPTDKQLLGACGYAVFCVVIDIVRRKMK